MLRKSRKVGNRDRWRHQVLVVGPALEQKGGMASVQKLILKEMPNAFKAEHISTHDEGSLWHRFSVFSAATSVLISKLLRNQVDLVHLHVSEKGSVLRKSLLMLLVKAFRRPVVMHAHGCEFHVFHESLGKRPRSLVNWALQQADCFITLSESWRAYYIKQCDLDPNRVVSLPNPVEMPEQLSNRAASDTVNFAFLGRIGHRKGAFDLLHAFAALPNREHIRLWLAGDGEVETAAALIESLGLGESVRLLGWINETERAEVLAAADVFVLPSYNEALPMALLEAMAAGLPVISTPVGGIPEFVTHQQEGYLVGPGDIDALSQAMEQLIADVPMRRHMGERSQARVRPLDLKFYSERLATIYSAVIENAPLNDEWANGSSSERAALHSPQTQAQPYQRMQGQAVQGQAVQAQTVQGQERQGSARFSSEQAKPTLEPAAADSASTTASTRQGTPLTAPYPPGSRKR